MRWDRAELSDYNNTALILKIEAVDCAVSLVTIFFGAAVFLSRNTAIHNRQRAAIAAEPVGNLVIICRVMHYEVGDLANLKRPNFIMQIKAAGSVDGRCG